MTGCYNLFIRNCKLFFKDKGMFFASLITPVILLVLYAAFLANVYRDSFISALPEGFPAAEKLIGGCKIDKSRTCRNKADKQR